MEEQGRAFSIGRPVLHLGDCVAWLASLPAESVDAIVTDPPYGLGKPPPIADVLLAWLAGEPYVAKGGGFMGKEWDSFVPGPEVWRECFRVLKPGGHLIAFAGTRTDDLLKIGVRLAGFEIRDSIGWVYYSGFPKSMDVSKQLDAAAGAEREIVGSKGLHRFNGTRGTPDRTRSQGADHRTFEEADALTAPASPEARRWTGWGTALKPAVEPAVLARKPLGNTVAASVLAHGTGALNIDGCRLAPGDPAWVGPDDGEEALAVTTYNDHNAPRVGTAHAGGRWPANLYYCPKAPRAERERGTDGLPFRTGAEAVDRDEGSAGLTPRAGAGRTAGKVRNFHPTVKPVRLMRWLCRLVTPPGGLVIDPFTGSGTTGIAAALEGFRFAGAEREPDYHPIAAARIAHALAHPVSWAGTAPGASEDPGDLVERLERAGQANLFAAGA